MTFSFFSVLLSFSTACFPFVDLVRFCLVFIFFLFCWTFVFLQTANNQNFTLEILQNSNNKNYTRRKKHIIMNVTIINFVKIISNCDGKSFLYSMLFQYCFVGFVCLCLVKYSYKCRPFNYLYMLHWFVADIMTNQCL